MIALDKRKNFAYGVLSTGYNNVATSITLGAGQGARFGTGAGDVPFNAIWWDYTSYPNPSEDPNREIVRVTAISGDTLTITRAQEGTSATNKNTAGKAYRLMLAFTVKTIDDIEAKTNAEITSLQNQINAITVPDISATFLSGEALTAGQALHLIDDYQPLGEITNDNFQYAGTTTFSFNVPSTSNRCLLVGVFCAGTTGGVSVSNVTWNGTTMTGIGSSLISNNGYGQSGMIAWYRLTAPATGTANVVITATGFAGAVAIALSNVDQTTPVDVATTTTSSVTTLNTTTLSRASKIIGMIGTYGISVNGGTQGMTTDGISADAVVQPGAYWAGFSKKLSTTSSKTVSYTYSSGGGSSNSYTIPMQLAIKPANALASAVIKTDASASKVNFVGFARQSVSANTNVQVSVNGVYSGLSGLTIASHYYLSNTPGAISLTPGSSSKKVGLAVDTTKLLIKNENA